ncbi:MAG: ectoine synthase [Pseudomonadota bacterium]
MLVRSFTEVEAAGSVVAISHGKSSAVRVLLKSDGLGFSLSEARCGAGNTSKLWYKNHWEANYVHAGEGTLINRDSGQTWDLHPGVLYCVGPNDKHSVANGGNPCRIISVFNPPIEGPETHDEDGAYPPTGEIPVGQPGMFVRTLDEVRANGEAFSLLDGKLTTLRMLKACDQLGFSLSDVRVEAGLDVELWYQHHWEVNLILSGKLVVTDHATGDVHTMEAGDVYCVGPHDKHHVRSDADTHLLCIFNPPLRGDEAHDEQGAYAPSDFEIPVGPQ